MARRKSHWADDLVLAPWWVSFGLAVVAFVFMTALPAPLQMLRPIVTLFLLAMAAISALRSIETAAMFDRQTSLESILELSWKRFEDLLGEAYRREGYKVTETLGGGADGGVDLVLSKNGQTILVQCKRWKGRSVQVQTVRELYGILHDRKATAAKLVATTSFTSDAIAFAANKPIELVDSHSLLQLIRGVQNTRSTPHLNPLIHARPRRSLATRASLTVYPRVTNAAYSSRGEAEASAEVRCPICNSVMVRRTARRGPGAGSDFWGCPAYPECRGTRSVAARVLS